MATATITSKGQITIPKEVRDALGVGTGDRVEFIAEPDGVYKVIAATRDIKHLKGLVPKPPKPVTVDAMKRAVARAVSKR